MTFRKTAMVPYQAKPKATLTPGASMPRYGVYGFFGVSYLASFWKDSQMVS